MNESLVKLAGASKKEERVIIGLMSGTSLDGLDIALCKIGSSGLSTTVKVIHFETATYAEDFRDDVKTIFSKKQVDLEKLALLHASIGALHAELINQFLEKYSIQKEEIDCIASHGQSIYHAPKRLHQLENYPNATFQIGDGDHIAVKTGIPVLSDFRQKHVAAGGEGAPLALYGDYALFSSSTENRVLLNMGGISNFTYLPKAGSKEDIMCTDVGPGNTLIDGLSKKYFNIPYDKNGENARRGNLNEALLRRMLDDSFFKQTFPKSTGPELFNADFIEQALQAEGINQISPEDLLHTATQLTADAIILALRNTIPNNDYTVYVSGGGAHNTFVREKIQAQLPGKTIFQMEELGISADSKEAVLFALLANETLCGSSLDTRGGPKIMMGKISLPY